MLRKIQVLLMSFHDPRQSLLEKMVAVLFGLAAANLCVVFLVQGGYEFSVGPILVHARYVLKSLRKIAFECPARKGGDEKCVLPEAAAIR
jgi:hypothetical protein